MDIALVLGIILAHMLGYTFYVRGMVKNKITPNTTTWSLFVFSVILDIPTYFNGVETEALIKSVLPVVDCVGVLVVWTVAFRCGKFERPDQWDTLVAVCQTLTIIIWKIAGAMNANLMLQVATMIAFIPVVRGVYTGKEVERPMPWMFMSIAYGLEAVIVYVHPHHGWKEYAYPLVCFVCHFVVGVLALRALDQKEGVEVVLLK